LGLTILKVVLE